MRGPIFHQPFYFHSALIFTWLLVSQWLNFSRFNSVLFHSALIFTWSLYFHLFSLSHYFHSALNFTRFLLFFVNNIFTAIKFVSFHLGHFGSFWVIFGHFWAILWHFWRNLRKVQFFLWDLKSRYPRFQIYFFMMETKPVGRQKSLIWLKRYIY